MTDIQTQLAPLSADDFRQDQTRVCTIMAFLIGVDWQKCSFYYEQEEKLYEELQANQECVKSDVELLRNTKSNGL